MNLRTFFLMLTVVVRIVYVTIWSWFDMICCRNIGYNHVKDLTGAFIKYSLPDVRFTVVNQTAFNQYKTIYVSNHPGLYDGIIIDHLFPKAAIVAKDVALVDSKLLEGVVTLKNLYYLLGNGRFTASTDMIILDNAEHGRYQSFLETIVERWPQNMWVFAAGGVVKRQFKTGVFRAAQQLGWKICPVRLEGFPTYTVSGWLFPSHIKDMRVVFGDAYEIPVGVDVVPYATKAEKWCDMVDAN